MSKLRDYSVTRNASPDPLPSATLKGDFIRIVDVQIPIDATNPPRRRDADVYVLVTFDDQQTIKMRAGDSIKNRPYERLTFDLINPDDSAITVTNILINFEAGTGIYEPRAVLNVPYRKTTQLYNIAGGSTNLLMAAKDFGVIEYRICIPVGETSGLFFGSESDVANGTPLAEWHDVGVVEFQSFCGDIYVTNPTGSPVRVSLSRIYRND